MATSCSREWVGRLGRITIAPLLTDTQLAELARTLADPRLPRALERHLRRARDGGPEYGADGSWFVVRATEPKPSLPSS